MYYNRSYQLEIMFLDDVYKNDELASDPANTLKKGNSWGYTPWIKSQIIK